MNFYSPILQKIFGKISRSNPKLAELIEQFGSGAQSGADKVLVVDVGAVQEKKLESTLLKPYLKGRNINKYQIDSNPDMLIFPYKKANGNFEIIEEGDLKNKYSNIYSYLCKNKTTLSDRKWFGKGPVQLGGNWYGMMYLDEAELFSKPHILTPSLSNRSSFAIGTGDLFATGTAGVTSIILKPDTPESIYYFLAILNSKLISHFITSHSPVFSGNYYKFSAPYLKNIPIKKINFDESEKSIEKPYEKLIKLYETRVLVDSLDKNDIEEKGSLVGSEYSFINQISKIIKKGKLTHDLLVYLAKQISKRKNNQTNLVNRFWDNLARVSDTSYFESLRNKGKWERSLAKDLACERYVDPESRSTKNLEESLSWDEEAFKAFAGMLIETTNVTPAMIEVYRKHAPEYQELSHRIEETDDLIDQIVYRLYGLTEEEIEIVESSFDE